MSASEESKLAVMAFSPDLRAEIGRILTGQDDLIDSLLIGLFTGGHILIEGVPGLAKTLAVKALALTVGGVFSRIQFTPDLLPTDIVGTYAYQPEQQTFAIRPGPVAANIVLADEINRAPAKVQSALLEAMQERQVTIAGKTIPLPDPFLVAATQNPLEHSGTFVLPEAQKDRFLMQVILDYPRRDEESQILKQHAQTTAELNLNTVASLENIKGARKCVDEVYIDQKINDYILDIVIATRPGQRKELSPGQNQNLFDVEGLLEAGASPRGAISLALVAKAKAIMQGRMHVLPNDVKTSAVPVLAHRLVTTFEADAQGVTAAQIVGRLVKELHSP